MKEGLTRTERKGKKVAFGIGSWNIGTLTVTNIVNNGFFCYCTLLLQQQVIAWRLHTGCMKLRQAQENLLGVHT